jgi:hypothetical protein
MYSDKSLGRSLIHRPMELRQQQEELCWLVLFAYRGRLCRIRG